MKPLLKFLHEVGTVGAMGSVVIQLVLSIWAANRSPEEQVVIRSAMLVVCRGFLLPSLVVVMVSGLLSMGLHRSFHNAEWVWIKALMTPLVLEGTVLAIDAPARAAAELSVRVAAGDVTATAPLAEAMRLESWGLWLALLLYTANIALSVWRPRFRAASRVPAKT
ncbi:MAG: hypothetical protein ACFB9M_05245 [Myxococcota bacterium]